MWNPIKYPSAPLNYFSLCCNMICSKIIIASLKWCTLNRSLKWCLLFKWSPHFPFIYRSSRELWTILLGRSALREPVSPYLDEPVSLSLNGLRGQIHPLYICLNTSFVAFSFSLVWFLLLFLHYLFVLPFFAYSCFISFCLEESIWKGSSCQEWTEVLLARLTDTGCMWVVQPASGIFWDGAPASRSVPRGWKCKRIRTQTSTSSFLSFPNTRQGSRLSHTILTLNQSES